MQPRGSHGLHGDITLDVSLQDTVTAEAPAPPAMCGGARFRKFVICGSAGLLCLLLLVFGDDLANGVQTELTSRLGGLSWERIKVRQMQKVIGLEKRIQRSFHEEEDADTTFTSSQLAHKLIIGQQVRGRRQQAWNTTADEVADAQKRAEKRAVNAEVKAARAHAVVESALVAAVKRSESAIAMRLEADVLGDAKRLLAHGDWR